MKRIITIGLFAALLPMFGMGAANATGGGGDQPDADNKKVEFCHATGSETNPFVMIETSVKAFYQAGHIDHADDIWEAFSYTTVDGTVVNVPAQGDTSLLAFEDCVRPAVDITVAKPDVTYADPCGTEDDVFSVAGGVGYTVGATTIDGVAQSITVTLSEGFVWTDETTVPITFTRPVFTNIDCDLPETGAEAVTAVGMGVLAIGGIVVIVAGFMTAAARKRDAA